MGAFKANPVLIINNADFCTERAVGQLDEVPAAKSAAGTVSWYTNIVN